MLTKRGARKDMRELRARVERLWEGVATESDRKALLIEFSDDVFTRRNIGLGLAGPLIAAGMLGYAVSVLVTGGIQTFW